MDELTQRRIALNDATFRAANENIERAADEHGVDGAVPFICECAQPTCTEVILVDRADYEEIRRNPRRFLNVPGHEGLMLSADAGRVVEERDGYLIVEKIGHAGAIAEQTADADLESLQDERRERRSG